MGHHNATAVIALAAEKQLGHAATRLGVHIALKTLDRPTADGHPACLYYAGRDDLAFGLGYLVQHYDRTDDGGRARRAAYSAVKRAVADLISAGLLELVESGSGHRRSSYRLLVPAPRKISNQVERAREINRGAGSFGNDF
jgi:hypothetical protein